MSGALDWAIDHIPFAKPEKKLPVVLSPQGVKRFLAAVTNPKYHAMLSVAYAGGLRVSEVTQANQAAGYWRRDKVRR